ncbi:MAG: glycoside hydrolase family 2 TIM barrel-domain containing protein [Melioribacteraceae bacterium]
MKRSILIIVFLLIAGQSFGQDLYKIIGDQLIKKDNIISGKFPEYTIDGKWKVSERPNWFAGFTSGELWYMYDITGNEEFKKRALTHADNLIKYATLDNTHDLGFIFFNSCVKAYQHTGEKKYKDAAIEAAHTLVKRYNTKGNFLRAWGKLGTPDREGLMIIDTMMNLELLFWAAKETDDYTLYDIAYKHAIVCMNEHVRSNYSSHHVVEFDPQTGKVVKKRTHQGFSDESTWARGEAWGIYGFAIAYKYTGDERFFNISKNMASYFLKNLPDDYIPRWDLDLKADSVVRDASAAAIAASGMFLLSELSDSKNDYQKYLDLANRITESLSKDYIFTNSRRKVEEGILLHTVYNYAKNWGINESYPAGDFYFIECLNKKWDISNKEKFIKDRTGREIYLINNNWFYLEDGIEEFKNLYQSAKEWKKINLPHTWNKSDALDQIPGYRRNISWYEKKIFIPTTSSSTIYKLHFEGVNNQSEVFINGSKAGGHVGGFVGFDVDITNQIKKGEINTIHVKADNSFDPNIVPSQKSDFVVYGGISRNVWLNILPQSHFEKLLVQTPQVSAKSANTQIQFTVCNTVENKNAKVDAVIKDKTGKIVTSKNVKVEIQHGIAKFDLEFSQIKNPILWSPDSPYLYTIELILSVDGQVIDKISDNIGYRWFEFKEHGAFYLNGERLLLRGTHRHEELSGYGNALPDSIHRNDIKMIKEMGANFVRLAHYPQALEVYRACDELGLLVWDENPWCRGGVGPKEWQENTKNIFKEMIEQNYNHPSIILWSIGNESDWLPDFYGGDNLDSLKSFAFTLHNRAKKIDPYRYTATRKFPAAQDIVDVYSPSIWSGWYSDVYKNYEKSITKARDTNKRLFHAEYGGDSHVGRHSETPIDGEGKVTTSGGDEPINKIRTSSIANIGDWSESYIVDLFDWYLYVNENLDWFPGSAQWIFRDFTTPLRPENPIPYVNQKGLLDMNNNPKDAYYVFKSYWTTNPKFCYIESHTWHKRYGATNEKKEVNVFSNCSEVELFINGISQGKKIRDTKKFPACGLSWHVDFLNGANQIKAIGIDDGKITAEDILQINFTSKKNDKPENLILEKSRMDNGNYLITAFAVDKNGNHCIDFNGRVYFSALSGGRFLDNTGTPSGSSVIELANGRAQIVFKHIPFEKGVIEIRNQDFKGTYLTIED